MPQHGISAPKGLTSMTTVEDPKGAAGSATSASQSMVALMRVAVMATTATARRSRFSTALATALATPLPTAHYASTVLQLRREGFVRLELSRRPLKAVGTATASAPSTRCTTHAGTRTRHSATARR